MPPWVEHSSIYWVVYTGYELMYTNFTDSVPSRLMSLPQWSCRKGATQARRLYQRCFHLVGAILFQQFNQQVVLIVRLHGVVVGQQQLVVITLVVNLCLCFVCTVTFSYLYYCLMIHFVYKTNVYFRLFFQRLMHVFIFIIVPFCLLIAYTFHLMFNVY